MDQIHPDAVAAGHVENAGKALFGEHWVRPLSALLNVNERTVQRIAAAARDRTDYPAARGLIEPLQQLLTRRALEFLMTAELMDQARPGMTLPPARCVTIPMARLREIQRPPEASNSGSPMLPEDLTRRHP
jgi:hypothetical protein